MSKQVCRLEMRSKSQRLLAVLVGSAQLFCLSGGRATAASADQNWPQWRGPLQNGVAPIADPPVVWSETNNVKWKVKIPGSGRATPIIWGNQVFIQTAISTGKKVEQPAAKASLPVAFGLPIAADPPPENPLPRRRPGGPGGPGGGMRGA